jgi:hypothetical protein
LLSFDLSLVALLEEVEDSRVPKLREKELLMAAKLPLREWLRGGGESGTDRLVVLESGADVVTPPTEVVVVVIMEAVISRLRVRRKAGRQLFFSSFEGTLWRAGAAQAEQRS